MTKFRLMIGFASQLSSSGIANMVIRQEDLAVDQPGIFRRVAPMLLNPSDELVPLASVTKRSSRTVDELKAYYSGERWRADFHGLESEVNEQIDWRLLEEFRYSPL